MALVKEDGTGVDGANTYALATDARAYAQARGVVLPADDAAMEALLLKAADYLEGFRADYQGSKTYTGVPGFHDNEEFELPLPADVNTHDAQAMQWPRFEVYIDDVPFSPSRIPAELVAAQCQCAVEQQNGLELAPASNGQIVKREKVDVIETEYMSAQEAGDVSVDSPRFPAVDALLSPLFGSGAKVLRTVRV